MVKSCDDFGVERRLKYFQVNAILKLFHRQLFLLTRSWYACEQRQQQDDPVEDHWEREESLYHPLLNFLLLHYLHPHPRSSLHLDSSLFKVMDEDPGKRLLVLNFKALREGMRRESELSFEKHEAVTRTFSCILREKNVSRQELVSMTDRSCIF